MQKLGTVLILAGALALGAVVTPSGAVEVLSWSWGLTQLDATHTADQCKKQGGLVVRKAGGQDACNIPVPSPPGSSAPASKANLQDFHFTQHSALPSSSAPAGPK